MNIKDYLHLYLGCEVQTEFGMATLVHVGILGSSDQIARTLLSGLSMTDAWVETNKLVLRPLSDMTQEEEKEMFATQDTVKLEGYPEITLKADTGETFRYMLSKGFDLFDLIESGLAIDKSKLKTLKQKKV